VGTITCKGAQLSGSQHWSALPDTWLKALLEWLQDVIAPSAKGVQRCQPQM